jgi:hypothetical protein
MRPFNFDRAKAERSIRDPDGPLWPVNAYTDADELDSLIQAALDSGTIARARLYVYPLSLSEPDPVPVYDPGHGRAFLGHPLKLREREGEDPVAFTLRLLEDLAAEGNALASDRSPSPPAAETASPAKMSLRCPDCVSEDAAPVDRGTRLECGNCGAAFARERALVTIADAEAHAEHGASCACSDLRGCPRCFDRAERLIGAIVRDSQGREWEVTEVDEKDGFPTVCGERFWARLDDVQVLDEAG